MTDPDPRSARLVVRRNSETDIQLRSIYVSVDGGPEKPFQFGDTAEINVKPGDHEITATNRLFTRRARFTVQSGEAAKFLISNRSGGCLLFFAAASGAVACRLSLERIAD